MLNSEKLQLHSDNRMVQRHSAVQATVTFWKIGRKSFTRDSELIYTYAPVYVSIKG